MLHTHLSSGRLIALVALTTTLLTTSLQASDPPQVLFTTPTDVSAGPLVPPPSPAEVTLFAGQPRIANDGTWYALYRFPVSNTNDPFETTRDFCMLQDGLVYVREGLQIPASPNYVPIADLSFSQQPFFDVSIAGDGTVAQVIRGTDQFTLAPDGTPNAPDIDVEDVKFDILLVDQAIAYKGGDVVDIVPGLLPPDNAIDFISTAKAANANRVLVKADLSAGGTFDPETTVIFEVTDPGQPSQSESLRFTDDENVPIPGLGFTASTFTSNEEDIDYNAHGSILLGIDIRGEPFNLDGAIVYYDAILDTYEVIAREGDPSPLPGRIYDSLFNKPTALNDNGDIAFLASVDGDSTTDGIIVVNGAVVAQEKQLVGTAVPGDLQLGFANANIEMDDEGNIIWYGAWNELKANVCPDNPDISSSFVIYEGIFFNDQLILEGGVTEVHNVTVDGVLYPTLVVKDLPNTGFAGFHVSPDGRWLIVHALLAEPSDDICAFSINNDATPVAQVLLRIDLDALAPDNCPEDLTGDETVDSADLNLLLSAFGCSVDPCGPADLNNDGEVGSGDLNLMLSAWGPCP